MCVFLLYQKTVDSDASGKTCENLLGAQRGFQKFAATVYAYTEVSYNIVMTEAKEFRWLKKVLLFEIFSLKRLIALTQEGRYDESC
jgi:hypothetical protein